MVERCLRLSKCSLFSKTPWKRYHYLLFLNAFPIHSNLKLMTSGQVSVPYSNNRLLSWSSICFQRGQKLALWSHKDNDSWTVLRRRSCCRNRNHGLWWGWYGTTWRGKVDSKMLNLPHNRWSLGYRIAPNFRGQTLDLDLYSHEENCMGLYSAENWQHFRGWIRLRTYSRRWSRWPKYPSRSSSERKTLENTSPVTASEICNTSLRARFVRFTTDMDRCRQGGSV